MSIVALLSLAMIQEAPVGRYELAERLKRLDVAWLNCEKLDLKRSSIPSITDGVSAYFTGRNQEAARALDEATAELESRNLRASDALSIRSDSPFYEPGASVTLKLSWTYRPDSVIPVRIGSGSKFIDLRPGSNGTLVVNPSESNAELRMNQEVGYLLPVRVGEDTRFIYLSFVRNYRSRISALTRSDNSFGRSNGDLLTKFSSDPRAQEVELPLIQYLFTAEYIAEGKQKLADLEQIYYGIHGATTFRALLPRSVKGKTGEGVNVVIAVHGAGGSENMFFESYGRGEAVTEAMKRKWVFISPRAGSTAINDCLAWITGPRGLKIDRLFLLGHSMGAGIVLSAKPSMTPAAVAALAPAGAKVSDEIKPAPLFLAVGKEELPPIIAAAASIANLYESRTDLERKVYEPCEHLMIGAEAIPDVFAFFDRYAK